MKLPKQTFWVTHFLLAYGDALIQSIKNGARIKMLFINPNGDAIKLMKMNSPTSSDVEDIHLSLRSIVSIAHKSKNSIKGGIEVRLIDWISRCSLIIIDPEKDKGKVIMGGIYILDTPRRAAAIIGVKYTRSNSVSVDGGCFL